MAKYITKLCWKLVHLVISTILPGGELNPDLSACQVRMLTTILPRIVFQFKYILESVTISVYRQKKYANIPFQLKKYLKLIRETPKHAI